MKLALDWEDYKIIGTSDGMKLENWKGIILLRPDPQVIWTGQDLYRYPGIDAVYHRSESGGGRWEVKRSFPQEWQVSYKDLSFLVKPMGFKHTGLFPEQAVNWDCMRALIAAAKEREPGRQIKVLNLFAYTGGASVACAKEGALVTHVDAAKGMVERASQNARLSGINEGIRYIVDDCSKFVAREIRRGNHYDAIIMDPPSYGRGPGGEMWKIEQDLFPFVEECARLLSEEPLFVLINSYTTGLQPGVLDNILQLTLTKKGVKGSICAYEVGLPTEEGICLPCGASGLFVGENYVR
ncbi:MAG: class I SAM-dependent methyltransferase [Clostridia bacterium]|nr:class I SAM-dependent methyltransferase [Clostridia bacterium]